MPRHEFAHAGWLESIFAKARFWQVQGEAEFNVHQHEMLNRLLDGFDGNLTSSKRR